MTQLADVIAKGKMLRANLGQPASSNPTQGEKVVPEVKKEAPKPTAHRRNHREFFEAPEALINLDTQWIDILKDAATAQLAQWIENKTDFATERMELIHGFAATLRSRTPEDYIAEQKAVTLDGKPFPEELWADKSRRKALIIDTVARWMFLEKRLAGTQGNYGGRYKELGNVPAVELARQVVEAEIARRR